MYVLTLGRLPKIALAELEALFGSANVQALSTHVAAVESDSIDHRRLGGTVRVAKKIAELPSSASADDILNELYNYIISQNPSGKINFAVSSFDGIFSTRSAALAIKLKKRLKASGISVRAVIGKNNELNAAEVLYNKLTSSTNFEFGITNSSGNYIIFRTVSIQDVDAYAERDHGRPRRDPRVGMLPPKLAQIIINLAASHQNPPDDFGGNEMLDPFCGTGVILQEAALMGYYPYGTDIDQRMIDYSDINLKWLSKKCKLTSLYNDELGGFYRLEQGDATTTQWEGKIFIASETYLGRPFSSLPKPEVLAEVVHNVDTLLKKFLKNVAAQTKSGFRMCIAVPTWQTPQGLKHLPLVDQIGDLGYTRQVFKHATFDDLVYSRPEQIVARELLVLIRK